MLYKPTDRREQTQRDQHQRDYKANIAAGYASQLNHPVVLPEAGVRKGIEHGGNKRVQAICQNAAFQTLHVQRAGDRLFGDIGGGRNIADGFQRGDHKDQHQWQQ
ncbi:hypothetical protein D3C73_1015200 [compost metagenome]